MPEVACNKPNHRGRCTEHGRRRLNLSDDVRGDMGDDQGSNDADDDDDDDDWD